MLKKKRYILIFLAVLIGFVVSQWSRSRSVEPRAEKEIPMPEHEKLSEPLTVEAQTPWQKYRTRKRLGLEGPASPESMLIIDMLQSFKSSGSTKDANDVKPEE